MEASTLARRIMADPHSALYLSPQIVVNPSLLNSRVSINMESTLLGERDTLPGSTRSFQLFGTLAPFVTDWSLLRPLTLDMEVDGTDTVLSDNVFVVYGVGASVADALRDYLTSLVELYQIVEKDVHDGVPYTDLEFARLKRYLQHL